MYGSMCYFINDIFNTDGTIEKADLRTSWYNYSNKEWANAVLVTENKYSLFSLGTKPFKSKSI